MATRKEIEQAVTQLAAELRAAGAEVEVRISPKRGTTMEAMREALRESGFMLPDESGEWSGIAYPHTGGCRVIVSPVAWEVQRHDVWRYDDGKQVYNGWSRVHRVKLPENVDRAAAFRAVAAINVAASECLPQ